MSGLCGWLASQAEIDSEAEHARLLARMAAPLCRHDDSMPQSFVSTGSAAAVAALADDAGIQAGAQLHHKDGLIIALLGRPVLAGALLQAADLAPLWRAHGSKVCASLCGGFALAIVDEFSGEALLAVDRSGIQPLFYRHGAHGLFFASSAVALLAHPAAQSGLDKQAIYNYLYFHMVPGPATIYQGQQRLLPGEYLHFRAGRLQRGCYWQMAYQERGQAQQHAARSFPQLKAEFLAILRSAVEQDSAGAVTGTFLSGGTDSSTLAGMLGQVSGRPARAYSIGFDAPGYDEMDYARIAARHFGAEHHERYVTADDVMVAIPRIAAIVDQPFGNASVVPAFYCAQMARADGVTRLLGGDGGDELFGGNERYARQAVFERYDKVPALLRQAILEPLLFKLAGNSRHKLLCKARSYIEQASLPLPARLETYNLLQRYGHPHVLEDGFLAAIDSSAPIGLLNQAYWLSDGHSQINRLLALDMKFTLADNDLPKVMKACELAGIEVAFPFLNDAMVEFSARLAPWQKLHGTQLRYFFKQALADFLPRQVLRKQKHGFGLPFGLWLQGHAGLRALAFDSLSALKKRRIVRASFIDDLQQRHLPRHPAYHGTMVWVLMMLEQWLQQHQDQQLVERPRPRRELA
ncbi:asparagine synthetase B family protein [Janthinobacterium agaricidamnosum]|uniref:asparagine synthase (glutamine-hydrolyzing) n=1 Tax=Janthinobacterium agaricidamnosum NBRC 102515 = DSM 9628 TaxID=1349767 RepID=W0V7G5_9BURK|nr:asparagine synthase-related protein [Janthinobacterium agaricidamnosum]CDG83293.1 asparagine synthase family protein [Janthinobacterium agaricidamnosum NBRC 102515 = DSM 9628]